MSFIHTSINASNSEQSNVRQRPTFRAEFRVLPTRITHPLTIFLAHENFKMVLKIIVGKGVLCV